MLVWLGEAAEAVGWIEKAMLLDPSEAEQRVKHLGKAHYVAQRYQEAIDAFKRCPRLGHAEHAYLAACFAALSNSAEAEKETAHVLESNPNFTIEAALERSPYALDSDREHQRETMLKAGLPA